MDEITKLKEKIADLESKIEADETVIMSLRASHAHLCRGIKAALGLKQWPEMSGLFADGVLSLLNAALNERK